MTTDHHFEYLWAGERLEQDQRREQLTELANRYGFTPPLIDLPPADPGTCDDCKHETDRRHQYNKVTICEPCARDRERVRVRLPKTLKREADHQEPAA